MERNKLQFSQGFTLIEMLVYTAIFAVMVSALAAFMATLSQSRLRSQAAMEVNEQGAEVLRVITQNLRNATAINSPIVGAAASSISINTLTASTTPTTFALSNGVIYMTQGVNPALALTNNRVSASNLSFVNLSRASTAGAAKVSFSLTAVSSSTQAQYNYSGNFYGSGTLR